MELVEVALAALVAHEAAEVAAISGPDMLVLNRAWVQATLTLQGRVEHMSEAIRRQR